MHRLSYTNRGFTLIELLIVTATLVILMVATMVFVLPSLNKGRDGRKKSDLQSISIALEEYYNNKSSYPAAITSCGSNTEIAAVLKNVPCVGTTKTPYLYMAEPSGCNEVSVKCRGYRLLTNLVYEQDPDIEKKGCIIDFSGKKGCYMGSDGVVYNYGIAVGRRLAD